MREILDIIDQLNESTGLAGRKPGDKFKNSQGEEIEFQQIQFFPEEGGKYEPEQLQAAIDEVSQQGEIQWQNKQTGKTGGFAIASFNSPAGPMYIGRFLDNVKPDPKSNYVPNNIGDFRFAGKAAEKTQSNLTPQDLLTQKIDLTVVDIMNQLAESLGTSNPLYAVAHRIAMGNPLPITFPAPEGMSFSGFRDYFCEILQPIALQKGQFTGNAIDAANKFLGGTFEGTLISFDDSKTAGLSDSIITNRNGQSVLVSTKGGKGATASAKNLLDEIQKMEETKDGRKFLKPYAEEVDLIKNIVSSGQAGSPLYLGVKYGIIDESDVQKIKDLKNMGPTGINNIKTLGLSKNLQKIGLERGTDSPDKVNLYYHLIAAIAHKAAEEVNTKTNFSKAAAAILNNGALIQVYTKAKEGKENWTLAEFETVYPGTTIKGVYLSAGKTYYGTNIKGNFTFKIDKGDGKPKDDKVNTPSTQEPEDEYGDDLAAASAALTGIPNKSKKDTSKVGDVGRMKRK